MSIFAHIWVIEASFTSIILEDTLLRIKENSTRDKTRKSKAKGVVQAAEEGILLKLSWLRGCLQELGSGLGPFPSQQVLKCNCGVIVLKAKQTQPLWRQLNQCFVHRSSKLVFTQLNLWCDLKQTAKHTDSKIPLVTKSQKFFS